METMEHNETDKCDCPGCYLNTKYEAEYAAYEKLPPYITMEMPERAHQAGVLLDNRQENIQNWLNERQTEGYEMTAVHDGLIFMRAIPPQGITQRDIIMEVLRRKKVNEVEFPATIGPVQ